MVLSINGTVVMALINQPINQSINQSINQFFCKIKTNCHILYRIELYFFPKQYTIMDLLIAAEVANNTTKDDITLAVEIKHGCKLIDITLIPIVSEYNLSLDNLRILNDDSTHIDILKIRTIFTEHVAKANAIKVDFENILKEYFIATLSEGNEYVQEGKLCSFLNSTSRTITYSYMEACGFDCKPSNDNNSPTNIQAIQDYKELRKNVSRKINTAISNILVRAFDESNSSSRLDLSLLDNQLDARIRSTLLISNLI